MIKLKDLIKEHTVKFTKDEMEKLHKDGKIEKVDGEGKPHTYMYQEGGPGSGPQSDDDNPFDKEPSDDDLRDIEKQFDEDSLGDAFHKKIQAYQKKIEKEKEAYRKAKERQKQRNESNLNEVDFNKIKLPSQVNRFLGRFVDSMKDANLNRMKRSAILYKVIDASGMSVQQLMADIQKIKKELK
tara:strand:+ start:19 stop:570 length:552 start_codon:yes stop_codon:yes gene_type:complete